MKCDEKNNINNQAIIDMGKIRSTGMRTRLMKAL